MSPHPGREEWGWSTEKLRPPPVERLAVVDVRATPEMKQALEGTEEIEVVLLDHEQVSKLCDNPDLPLDAKAWCALYMYQQLGRLA